MPIGLGQLAGGVLAGEELLEEVGLAGKPLGLFAG